MSDWEVVGTDVSYWQGEIDWSVMKQKAQFSFIRAGYGNSWIDPFLHENSDEADAAGVEYGIYWYVKPGKDWRKHAESFAAQYGASSGKLPPVADIESTGGLTKSELNNWLTKFVNKFEELTDTKLMIYTSPGFWNSNMPMTNWAKWLKLWVAHWTTADAPILPNDWTDINNPRTWEFWQWTSKGTGREYGASSTNIDLNRYHGSVAEFNAEYGTSISPINGEVPEPPPVVPPVVPPEPTEEFTMEVVQDGLRVRSGPGTEFAIIGELPIGQIVPVHDIGGSGAWVEIAPGQWSNVQYGNDVNMIVNKGG